ncbi:MAG: hypothetical protein Q8R59_03215 [Polaromonas sp.]|nr:hypothetical protein [Polaromonas sp.]
MRSGTKTFLITRPGAAIASASTAPWGTATGGPALFVQQYGPARHAPLPVPAPSTQT